MKRDKKDDYFENLLDNINRNEFMRKAREKIKREEAEIRRAKEGKRV